MKIGLKLWSINTNAVPEANRLFHNNTFDFLELYTVPGTFEHLKQWQEFEGPVILHCPHFRHNFNLAQSEKRQSNLDMFHEVQQWADALHSESIVTHGGNTGFLEETINQLNSINDQRILIENKPKLGQKHEICIGYSPDQIVQILDRANIGGFVLDFGHAICAANAEEKDMWSWIEDFQKLNPKLYHLGDGDKQSKVDIHENFGQGDFDIVRIVSFIQDNPVSIETPGNPNESLDYFVKDANYLKGLCS